jgi:heme/copper-type cytochrome/quinol oxidase subunit 2
MNSTALVLMATVQITVTLITAYFFWRVYNSPEKKEE